MDDLTPRDVIARAISSQLPAVAFGRAELAADAVKTWLDAAGWGITRTDDHLSAKFVREYLTDLAADLDGEVPGNQPHPASVWLRGCVGMVVPDVK